MWPMKLDMTRDECRGVLRRLELESYSSVMSTFRAQGTLCKEKTRILEELRKLLHIPQDRHKAEARRVANDERLTTVAEIMSGPNTTQDWSREGRRAFPILPRTAPYTALSYIANTVCEQISRENGKLPHPFETTQNRLQKEQEEERKQLLEKQQKELQQSQLTAAVKLDKEASPFVPAMPIPETPLLPPPSPPPVVTMDPFVEAANKSYINNDLKRSYPVGSARSVYSPAPMDDESPLRKKPQLYQELQKQEQFLPNPIVTFQTQPYPPQFPIPQPLSPHKNLTSPNNFGLTPNIVTNNNNNNNNLNTKPPQGKNNNKTERPRKTPATSKKNQSKAKTPYQSNKQSKANKNSIAQQQQQQQQQQHFVPQPPITGGPMVPPVKGNGKNNSASSPHLIHSYASPVVPYDLPQHHGTPEAQHEPLQLQKHLTSNVLYQPQQQQPVYGMTGIPMKSPTFPTPFHAQQAPPQAQQLSNVASNTAYGQHQILPSSKKDIQYNLTKLNPTNNMPTKANVNIPLKQSSNSSMMQSKVHPLLNYQKKSPSKNVLIPTSSAAATLASLGIPKTFQPRKDNMPMGKFREPDPMINPADIPNPKIIFSTSAPIPPHHHHHEPAAIAPKPAGNQITILDQITLHPPSAIVPSASSGVSAVPGSGSSQFAQAPIPVTHVTPVPSSPGGSSPLGMVPAKPVATASVTPKVVTLKGPNLAGFTPVKSGSKLSVHKLQLMPIGQPGVKSNVIVLPAKSANAAATLAGGTLNPGQKITIPRSSVMTNVDPASVISIGANAISPPKVIVQQQPDLNNIVVFDIGSESKLKASTSGVPPVSGPHKSVITEDTPIDIVATPLDVVTGAVKLQELSKGFLSSSSASSSGSVSTASPLTDKMVKPHTATKYNSNSNSSIATKATKFEADSTAPGPSVTANKKTKINHQGRAGGMPNPPTQAKKLKTTTTAAASSTTAGNDNSGATGRNPVMSSTDWELELDQANQATTFKSNNLVPKASPQKPIPKTTPATAAAAAAATVSVTTPAPITTTTTTKPPATVASGSKRAPQPLSSSSISSTSSSASSPVVDQPTTSGPIDAAPRIAAPRRPIIPVSVPAPVTPIVQKQPPATTLTTTPPNERSDDTSATDSADAEEDPEVGEDELFNAVIEEEVDPEEADDIHGERVEIVNVGYDTSRALIADLEGADSGGSPVVVQPVPGAIAYDKNGTEINPSSMNFEQYIEEAGDTDGEPTGANGSGGSGGVGCVDNDGRSNITFEMVEIDADGNKHARTLSYEEALAEGHITTDEVKSAPPVAAVPVVGGSTLKGKTKHAS